MYVMYVCCYKKGKIKESKKTKKSKNNFKKPQTKPKAKLTKQK